MQCCARPGTEQHLCLRSSSLVNNDFIVKCAPSVPVLSSGFVCLFGWLVFTSTMAYRMQGDTPHSACPAFTSMDSTGPSFLALIVGHRLT